MNFYTFCKSPIGELLLVSDGDSLSGLFMELAPGFEARGKTDEQRQRDLEHAMKSCRARELKRDDQLPLFKTVKMQLQEYFQRERREFELPIKLKMIGTDFQKSVWQQLCKIPYGTCVSYGEISRRISNPSASRAVGLANGRNPISIIVPCHRVIGADGSLTGYGGGLDRKKFLLELESSSKHLPVETLQLSLV